MTATFLSVSSCLGESQARTDPHEDAMAGHQLGVKEAAGLEAAVARQPDDLSARTKLLGYYFGSHARTAEEMTKKRNHVLWFIKNRPDDAILGLPYGGIDSISDHEGYHEAKKLWLEQIQAQPQNVAILGNAAKFVFLSDQTLAEELLKKAGKLEPGDPQWPDRLGQLYSLQSDESAAAKALAEYEKAQAADPEKMTRFYRLAELAKAAFKAGETAKASLHANALLKAAGRFPNDWNHGNAIHHGNNVLGRIALKQGDAKLAAEYLLKAGKTPGSPQLNSFGPNMTLAKELLEKDGREPVLEYFELCRKFWEMGGERLDLWSKQVQAGLTPDFGGNLAY